MALPHSLSPSTTTATATATSTSTPSSTATSSSTSFSSSNPNLNPNPNPDLDSTSPPLEHLHSHSRPSPATPSSNLKSFAERAQLQRLNATSTTHHTPAEEDLHVSSSHSPPSTAASTDSDRPGTYKHASKQSRGAGLLTFAALAREKTTSAIASLSEPVLRDRTSSSSLYRSAQSSPTATSPNTSSPRSADQQAALGPREPSDATNSSPSQINTSAHTRSGTVTLKLVDSQTLLGTNPPSQAYSNTSADTPAPIALIPSGNYNKMHQTSSRLLRMTTDDRPYTRDFKDLFATLVVSLPLGPHRVRLTRVDHSFLSEEAINNLGSLKFSQSNRMPDPKDPSRIVTTTTTTTFSMAREMARSVCQRFLDARFVESADGKQAKEFTMKNSVWQLTPKGIHVLERFCSRNGIQQKHVTELVNSPKNTMQLVILERDPSTDKLSSDRSTIEVIFRRFIGAKGPNVKSSTSSADSDSLSEYKDGIAGVRMAAERKVGSPPKTVLQTFTGKAATDWLMDCCTTVDRRETIEIASLFLEHELIGCVQIDRAFLMQFPEKEREGKFQPTKHGIYQLTQKGKDILNMVHKERTSESELSGPASTRAGVSRDSNTQKLDKILNDAALRLLFRENLRDTHCEENLSFYLDVDEFLTSCKNAVKSPSRPNKNSTAPNLDAVKETMASAYGIYNAFLAPGSPNELNIDHLLRNQLATRMTKAVGQDDAMIQSLKEVTKLFEEAQISVFKLMASDSVPKFMKSSKYEQTLKNYDFDSLPNRFKELSPPERTMSRSNR